jgi:hypothetical protein
MSNQIEIQPASASVTTTVTKSVATEVCDTGNSLIPVNIDCSLCALGFPQYGGTIGITFYGPVCEPNSTPIPSEWLGASMKMSAWKCPDPGPDAEPSSNTWKTIGYFDGVKKDDTCYRKYRFIATLNALGPSRISVSVSVQTLVSNLDGSASWAGYTSFASEMKEVVNLDTTKYRIRNFSTPEFISISPSQSGGVGDPVSYVKMIVIMNSMRQGCDSYDYGLPTCGFWDGNRWITCLQAFVKTRSTTTIRAFGQLGFNPKNCGTSGNYCGCDQFTLTALSPPTGTAEYNNTNDFFSDYGVLGIAGGVEAVGVVQQIQFVNVGETTMGGIVKVAVKFINGSIYACTNDGSGWVCGQPTVVKANSPHIMIYQPYGKDYDLILYGMQFPNPNILSDQCSQNGGIPAPSPNDPFWCVSGECVKSFLQPSGSNGGPYGSLIDCEARCVDGLPYWCWYGHCLQRSAQPVGSTGPFNNASECGGSCGDLEIVYTCRPDGVCFGIPKWSAVNDGIPYYNTQQECVANCVLRWYCGSDGNCYESAEINPAWSTSGPYANQQLCDNNCSPVMQMSYSNEIKYEDKEKIETKNIILERIKIPCINRGKRISDQGFT